MRLAHRDPKSELRRRCERCTGWCNVHPANLCQLVNMLPSRRLSTYIGSDSVVPFCCTQGVHRVYAGYAGWTEASRTPWGPGDAPPRFGSRCGSRGRDFRCSVPGCGWVKQNVSRQAAFKHMQRRHPGLAREVSRTAEAQQECRKRRLLPDDERVERDRARCRRYRAEVKVSTRRTRP